MQVNCLTATACIEHYRLTRSASLDLNVASIHLHLVTFDGSPDDNSSCDRQTNGPPENRRRPQETAKKLQGNFKIYWKLRVKKLCWLRCSTVGVRGVYDRLISWYNV